jgi:hypothetical protein
VLGAWKFINQRLSQAKQDPLGGREVIASMRKGVIARTSPCDEHASV